MADIQTTGNGIAALRNVMSMVTLVQRVIDRPESLPGMATYYGPSGYGKSSAAAYAANVFNAIHIETRSTWTKKTFCEVLIREMGIPPVKTVAAMVEEISRELRKSGRPLLIDEADTAVDRGFLEMIRDIYEISDGAVILIGEEDLPTKLTRSERIHGRMLDWVAAEPAVIDDVDHLSPYYAKGIDIDGPLKEQLLTESGHSIRRICVNLASLREHSLTHGLSRVTKKDWSASGKHFFSGKPPRPRGRE